MPSIDAAPISPSRADHTCVGARKAITASLSNGCSDGVLDVGEFIP
jgi:hypothetical protein